MHTMCTTCHDTGLQHTLMRLPPMFREWREVRGVIAKSICFTPPCMSRTVRLCDYLSSFVLWVFPLLLPIRV